MLKIAAVALALVALSSATLSLAGRPPLAAEPFIDTVVVLMLENRPMSHLLGWMNKENPAITGLHMGMFEEYNGVKYYVNNTAPYIAEFDPCHSFDATTMEMYGSADPQGQPDMRHFIKQAILQGQKPPQAVLNSFTPDRVPAISTLAREFTLFNHFHASFPGETVINRVFHHMGQADRKVGGGTLNIIEGWAGKTIYDVFTEQNVSWSAYFEDVSDLWYTKSARNIDTLLEHFHFYDEFKQHAAQGALPKFSWISPRFYADFGKAARDQHPRHDVRDGEHIMAEIYEALRASPKWNSTAFLIIYDEHGGFSDPVVPPNTAPPMPASDDNDKPFNWTRLGVRIPAILISPWATKGFVEQKPATAAYEHTSVYKTVSNLWNLPFKPLSARQQWTAPFDHLLRNRTAPRTDCPASVPTPPLPKQEERDAEALRQRNLAPGDLQREFYLMVEGMHGRDGRKTVDAIKTVGEMGDRVREGVRAYFELAKAKKQQQKQGLLSGLKH